jgi:DNA-binding phage protein
MTAQPVHHDWIQTAVVARAQALGLTAGEIAEQTGGQVSRQHVHAYLTGQASMGSSKLQHVLRVLGLQLVASQTAVRRC